MSQSRLLLLRGTETHLSAHIGHLPKAYLSTSHIVSNNLELLLHMKLLTIHLGILVFNLLNLFIWAHNALFDLILEFVEHIYYDINALCQGLGAWSAFQGKI